MHKNKTFPASIRVFFILLISLLVSLPVTANAEAPAGAVYLDGQSHKHALILAHGRGKHPTWLVVDPLRKGAHTQLGYHTLSLQMPNADKNFKAYAEDFPAAFSTIDQAIRFLNEERGVAKIYLMGHSMGARMVSAYMAEFPHELIAGLIVAGCRNNGGIPLDCKTSLQAVQVPVLDIWGGGDDKDNEAARERAGLVSDKYRQVSIANADHKFDGDDEAFVTAVIAWLNTQH